MIKNLHKWLWNQSKHLFEGLPFIYFIAALGLIYIANAHRAEAKVRKIQKVRDANNELRWKHMSLRSDIMYEGIQSRISEKIERNGDVWKKSAPIKISDEK